MSVKKSTRQSPMKPKRPLPPEQHSEVMEVLTQLQQKVLGSAALNGGFDTLLFKMNNIEEKQGQLVSTVDSIHEAIYHPDDGLFARVKSMEHIKGKVENVSKLEKDVYTLQQWHNTREKDTVKEEKVNEEQEKLIETHAEKIRELDEFKTLVSSVLKWLAVALASATVALIGKLVYTLVTGHISVKLRYGLYVSFVQIDVIHGASVKKTIFDTCKKILEVKAGSSGQSLVSSKLGTIRHSNIQTIFNLRFSTREQQIVHDIIMEHAVAAEKSGPGGFDSCTEIIARKIVDCDYLETAHNSSSEFKIQSGVTQASYPTVEDLTWLVDTYMSTSNDRVRSVFYEAVSLVGFGGKIAIEKSKSSTNVELINGYTFSHSSTMNLNVRMSDPKVVCVDGFAERVSELNAFFEAAVQSKERVVFFVRGMSGEVMETIRVNNGRGAFSIFPIVVKYDVEGINTLNDIAVVCGCDLLSTHKGETFSNIDLAAAPKISSSVIDRDRITIVNKGSTKNVSIHTNNLIKKREENSIVDVRELLDKRIRSLTPKHVVIRLEDTEDYVIQSQAIDYALRALRSLVDHGTVTVDDRKVLTTTHLGVAKYSQKCLSVLRQIGAVVTS